METSFIKEFERAIKENWERKALTDYKGETYYYKDVARRIEKIHLIFERCGVERGDRIALVGRNSSNWAITFIATVTYGAVIVPILHDFKVDNIHHIINHSEAKVVFAGESYLEQLDEKQMPQLNSIVSLVDFSITFDAFNKEIEHLTHKVNVLYKEKFPEGIQPSNVCYEAEKSAEGLCLLNYTSGTTGYSKGVMLPYRSLMANYLFAKDVLNIEKGEKVVSLLPLAHAYGAAFEFIYEFLEGVEIVFITKNLSPKIILDAFGDVKPRIILLVPLILEKIYRKEILPKISTPAMKVMLSIPGIQNIIYRKINDKITSLFGGNFIEVIIGGAALNPDVDAFLKKIGFRYTVGYGMTECGPIIAYAHYDDSRVGSCGKIVKRLQLKISSSDPYNEAGEILVKGENVMLGYYKNEEATDTVLEEDGWMHTGDLAVVDHDGFIYIKGRSKNMILGPSGQNIYPEEIENRLNNLPFVNESLVVESNSRLVALVFPDVDAAKSQGINEEELHLHFEKKRHEINKQLPAFCQISALKLRDEEFEKTPKKSIKRFLYQAEA
jgi:Long-chain acyl-CoA synthetases (AMP-forming)